MAGWVRQPLKAMRYVKLILKYLPNEKPKQAASVRSDTRGGVVLYRADGTVLDRLNPQRIAGMTLKCISGDEAYIDYIHHCKGGAYRGVRVWHRSCQYISTDAEDPLSRLEATGPVYHFPVSDPGRWDRLGPERAALAEDHPDLDQILTGKITFEAAVRMRP